MARRASSFIPVTFTLLFACSSSSSSNTPSDAGADAPPPVVDSSVAIDAFLGAATEHGIMVDYETQMPLPGITVTDNGMSTTTDMNGAWSLMVPAGTPFLSPSLTGPSYTNLFFPQSVPAAADIDFSTAVMPTSNTFQLEQSGLSNDTTKAIVQVVVVTAPTCASVVGGTLKVLAPAGATLVYFGPASLPDDSATSFQAVSGARPVAVVYNVTAGADLSLQMTHPTCKQVPFPFFYQGKTYTGKVPTKPTEPGDVNSALLMMLE